MFPADSVVVTCAASVPFVASHSGVVRGKAWKRLRTHPSLSLGQLGSPTSTDKSTFALRGSPGILSPRLLFLGHLLVLLKREPGGQGHRC